MNSNFDSIIDEMSENLESSKIVLKGKNNRSDIIGYGYRFDSKEELDVFEWILEAKKFGFVEEYEYQPKSFELFSGFKNEKGKFIVRPHVYTADFKVKFTNEWVEFRKLNKIKIFDKIDEINVYMDIKGSWSIYDDGRSFQINSKWVLDKFGIYVWKVIPIKLFEKTWLPENCILTRKTKKISAKYSKFKTFNNKNFKK